jgi:hypothetical protein
VGRHVVKGHVKVLWRGAVLLEQKVGVELLDKLLQRELEEGLEAHKGLRNSLRERRVVHHHVRIVHHHHCQTKLLHLLNLLHVRFNLRVRVRAVSARANLLREAREKG